MRSRIAAAIEPELAPVAISFAEAPPEKAVEFTPGRWGCVMWLLAAAARGKVAAASRETFGCIGGGTGLGFGNQYVNWPGGEGCFYGFLSEGNDATPEGRAAAEAARPFLRPEALETFRHGERYVATPEHAREFVEALPITEIPAPYVVFEPLDRLPEAAAPEAVVFLVDPDRLAALVVLANYRRGRGDGVVFPYAAGCQTIGIHAFFQARSEHPRAVVGLADLSARTYLAKQLGRNDLLTFTAPFALFREMEASVEGSFLELETWRGILAARQRG